MTLLRAFKAKIKTKSTKFQPHRNINSWKTCPFHQQEAFIEMLSLNCRNTKEYTRKDSLFGHISVCLWHQTLHLNKENGGYAWVALSLHGKDAGYCQEQSCKDADCIDIEHPDGLSDGTMPDDACNRSRRHLLPFSQGHSQKKQIGTSTEDSLWFTGMVANDPRIYYW